jgi:MFS family permease
VELNDTVDYPRFRWLVLLIACLGYAGAQINMIAFAPLLPGIAKDLQVDLPTATNLMTVFLFWASVALIGGGFLCDRFGIMFVVELGLLCASVPAVAFPWIGTSYYAVFWIRLVQGLSMGFLMCAMAPIVAVWFPLTQKGLASGIMGASISLGSAAGVLTAPLIFMVLKSWQQTVAWLSIVGWAGLALTAVTLFIGAPQPPSKPQTGMAPPSSEKSFKQALSFPFTWVGVLVTFFAAWCLQTLYNQTPAYFAADKPIGAGFGAMFSGQLMLSVMIAGMIGPIIGGVLQDKAFRGNPQPVMLIGFTLSGLCIYPLQLPVVYENTPFLVALLFLAGAGIQFVYPGIVVLVSKSYPVHIVGKTMGLWFGIGAFGGAAGLFAGGLAVASQGNYTGAISLMALGGLLGVILMVILSRLRTPVV